MDFPDISNGKYPLPLLKSSLSALRASPMKQIVFSCIHVTTQVLSYPLGSRAHDLQTGPCNSVALPRPVQQLPITQQVPITHSRSLGLPLWRFWSWLALWNLQLPRLSRCLTHTRCESAALLNSLTACVGNEQNSPSEWWLNE